VGLDAINLNAMRWAMQSWERVAFVNRYFAGTVLPASYWTSSREFAAPRTS